MHSPPLLYNRFFFADRKQPQFGAQVHKRKRPGCFAATQLPSLRDITVVFPTSIAGALQEVWHLSTLCNEHLAAHTSC